LGQEVAPPTEQEAPAFQLQKDLIKEEEIKKDLEPLITALNDEAKKYLTAVGLDTAGDFTVEAIERDGLDIKISIHTGNFARVQGKTEVYFDFAVKLPGADELETQQRGEKVDTTQKAVLPGSWWKGDHLMIDKLGYALWNVLNGVLDKLQGSKTLQEVSVSLCNKFLVEKSGDASPLLNALAFLQKVPTVAPGTLRTVPEAEPGSEDAKAWFAAFIKRLREGDLHRTIRERMQQANWLDRNFMKDLTERLVAARLITQEQKDAAMATADSFANDSEYAQFVKEVIEGKPGAVRGNREQIEKAVRAMAQYEQNKYKATAPVHIGTDPKTEEIIAKIDAPGSPTYVFKKGAGGGAPQLVSAAIEICGDTWTVTTPQDASKLFNAATQVTVASSNSIDSAFNEDHESIKEADMVRKLFKLMEKAKEEETKIKSEPEQVPVGDMFSVPPTADVAM